MAAKLPGNHNTLYFDKLCRTQKGETVQSLIYATYQVKKNKTILPQDTRKEIAKKLEHAYNLFKTDAGSYVGSEKQFESQYTIGHELCIWKNSNLDLTDLAIQVAENNITIRDYFDIVFLNYIQPVNGKIVHLLYHVLVYMKENSISRITKEQMKNVYEKVGGAAETENVNAAYNMLLASSYFKPSGDGKELVYSCKKCSLPELCSMCNITYVEKGYEAAKAELATESAYISYLLADYRPKSSTESNDQNEMILENDEKEKEYSVEQLGAILSKMYNNPEVTSKTTAIHAFGIKYGNYILSHDISAVAIGKAAKIGENYHVEIGKGIRLYEAFRDNEFGIHFYKSEETENEKLKNCLEVNRNKRIDRTHPLNLIIYGAPGTGKTYSTAEYALAIVEHTKVDLRRKSDSERKEVMDRYNELIKSGRVVFTTFHQSYGYEEFIQGLRPDTSSEKMSFRVVDGVFKRISDIALNDPDNNYVIIIDEINRANISKVFGELITLVEEDKRWGEINQTCVTLQSGDVFAVPNNLYIVGTMNSADKSISLIDAALRRRFEFIEQRPQPALVENDTLREVLTDMNEKLADELESADLLIGHSYFMNREESELPTILNNSIIPLLYEYFYDSKKKVATVLDYSVGDLNIEMIDDKLGRLSVKKKDS